MGALTCIGDAFGTLRFFSASGVDLCWSKGSSGRFSYMSALSHPLENWMTPETHWDEEL